MCSSALLRLFVDSHERAAALTSVDSDCSSTFAGQPGQLAQRCSIAVVPSGCSRNWASKSDASSGCWFGVSADIGSPNGVTTSGGPMTEGGGDQTGPVDASSSDLTANSAKAAATTQPRSS